MKIMISSGKGGGQEKRAGRNFEKNFVRTLYNFEEFEINSVRFFQE